ncbi:MAG: glycoside hydrolase family 70 protein, partial [Streptococcus sp.]
MPHVLTATVITNKVIKLDQPTIRTDGTDYQGKYGGAFLDELKAKYPSIFNRVQISNGKQLPTNEKITKWSAKYFNGTNILGRGINYVLRDDKTNQYFNTSANGQLL